VTRFRVIAAPAWARWLIYGGLFAVIEIALAPLLMRELVSEWRWPTYVMFAVVVGVAFGGVIAAITQPAHRTYLSAVAGLGPEDRQRAAAALRTGEAPTNPAVLAAAIKLGQSFLNAGSSTTQRLVLNVVVAVAFLGAGIVYLTHDDAPLGGFWIGLSVLYLAATLWERYNRQRTHRNVERLRAASSGVSPP
jgi:hypothetical protein